MECPNCHTKDWKNVDEFRLKPAGMEMCKGCGMVSYPAKWKTPEEIKVHYRSSYRNPPGHSNVFSCERKNQFHHAFLMDLFTKWKAEGLENPKILEIGAAFGFTLNYIRMLFPKAELHGTELTTSFRRNAYHEFGIVLTEEIDETKKYDLIMSYKVLEHQLDPDKELARYQKLLTESGQLYMSVPTWFNTICNFGLSGFDLEYYYDPNHVNVWTRPIFENILQRSGFMITKEDHMMYNDTYLCKPNEEMKKLPVYSEDPDETIKTLSAIKKAFIACNENRFDDAIALYPNYPQAHASGAEMKRRLLTEKGWEWFKENILEKAIKDCPLSVDMIVMAADFSMRAEKFEDAIKYSELGLKVKPENPISLHQLANTMREIAMRRTDPKEKIHYFVQARNICAHLRQVSSQHFKEATDLLYLFNSKIPFKGEADQQKNG